MEKIEDVIKALDCRANGSDLLCSECAYYRYSTKDHPGFCNFTQAMRDAIVLLKEVEDGRKIVEDYLKNLGITKMPII